MNSSKDKVFMLGILAGVIGGVLTGDRIVLM